MSEFKISPGHKMILKPDYNQCQFKNNRDLLGRCTSIHLQQVIKRINTRKQLAIEYNISDNRVFYDRDRLLSILDPKDITEILFDDKKQLILDPYY